MSVKWSFPSCICPVFLHGGSDQDYGDTEDKFRAKTKQHLREYEVYGWPSMAS